MNIIEKKISELKAYENNPKIHTDRQVELIAKSIEMTKGLRQPIVIDSNNVVVVGHGRLLACKQLGYKTVPCELVDDLTDDEIKAYRLIDNELAKGEIDLDLFVDEIESIGEIDMSEFDIDIPDMFSVDDIQDFGGYDKNDDDREYFNKTFTFPIDKKKAIISYLSKHQNDVIERIIKEAEKDG